LTNFNQALTLRNILNSLDAQSPNPYKPMKDWLVSHDTSVLFTDLMSVVAGFGVEDESSLDSKIGALLSGIPQKLPIPSIAGNIKNLFDSINGITSTAPLTLGADGDGDLLYSVAVSLATESIVQVVAESRQVSVEQVLSTLSFEGEPVKAPSPDLIVLTDNFSPGSFTYDVEKIIRLNTEFEDHNIQAMRHKSFANTEKDNSDFADMSRSMAAFVWAVNKTIDEHRDDDFVYVFDKLGTEHLGRVCRSWGIKDIDSLIQMVESIMKGIVSIYESDEQTYTFPIPNLESDNYLNLRYLFNVALASISSAHVSLFCIGFDSTQSGLYGEVRRVIREVQGVSDVASA